MLSYLRCAPLEGFELRSSWCRYADCAVARTSPRSLGCCTHTDGVWAWPEGLAHYVECHHVRPPSAFVAHALATTSQLRARGALSALRNCNRFIVEAAQTDGQGQAVTLIPAGSAEFLRRSASPHLEPGPSPLCERLRGQAGAAQGGGRRCATICESSGVRPPILSKASFRACFAWCRACFQCPSLFSLALLLAKRVWPSVKGVNDMGSNGNDSCSCSDCAFPRSSLLSKNGDAVSNQRNDASNSLEHYVLLWLQCAKRASGSGSGRQGDDETATRGDS